MRSACLVMIVLAVVGSAPTLAADRNAIKEARYTYAHCNCHFGYGNACSPTVTCATEGGRCSGSCVPPRQTP
jgi:hypothetical protein